MFCEKCGKQLNDGAAFCRYCGNKINNTNESGNTMNNSIPMQPVNTTNYSASMQPNNMMNSNTPMQPVNMMNSNIPMQSVNMMNSNIPNNFNQPKKKNVIKILIPILAILIISVVVFSVFLSDNTEAKSEKSHSTEHSRRNDDDDEIENDDDDVEKNEDVDSNYTDIVRLIQGDWYVEESNGTCHCFTFDGHEYSDYTYNLDEDVVSMTGARHFTIDGEYQILIKGELELKYNGDDTDYIYYEYDKDTNSITLTYQGIELSRDIIEEE